MVPSGLQEIFGTLSVGIFAVVIVLLSAWLVKAKQQAFHKWLCAGVSDANVSTFVAIIIFFGFYGIGIIVENITDHLTDSEPEHYFESYWWPPYTQAKILVSEKELRFQSLITKCKSSDVGKDKACSNIKSFKLANLGVEVIKWHKGFVEAHYSTDLKKADQQKLLVSDTKKFLTVNSKSDEEKIEVAKSLINSLYYTAKNWSYGQKNYYTELDSIQRYIEYTRSSFLILSWGMLLLIIVVPVSIIIGKNKERKQFSQEYPFNKQIIRLIIVILVLTAMAFFAREGYHHTELNYNERAFGYYISHLKEKEEAEKKNINLSRLYAHQWMQASAEYKAVCVQIYNQATASLKAMKKRTSEKPDAVVMDLDETVFNNEGYQAESILNNRYYEPLHWEKWLIENRYNISAIPGSLSFIKEARSMGVKVVFISNRPDSKGARKATIDTLKFLGVDTRDMDDENSFLLNLQNTNDSSKEERRKLVAGKFNVLISIGDNLADFSKSLESKSVGINERDDLVLVKYRKNWGVDWFVIPNPIYGDWRRYLNTERPLSDRPFIK